MTQIHITRAGRDTAGDNCPKQEGDHIPACPVSVEEADHSSEAVSALVPMGWARQLVVHIPAGL
jgi:hypothetical protein